MPKQQLRQWYKIVTASAADPKEPTSAEVLIYDTIDSWFGVSAQELVNELKTIDVDELAIRVNSPGGSAFDGIAIYNALKRHPANVTTYNDGLAASAASFIIQAGDKRVTSKYAETMVHGASTVAVGKADDLRAIADQIDRLNGNMAQLYADATGGTVEDWLAVMDAETWYTGEEAVAAGLYDEVDPAETPADKKTGSAAAAASFDLSQFKYAGRQAAPDPFKPQEARMKFVVGRGSGGSGGVAGAKAAALGPDPDDDPNALLAGLDATLDEAAKIAGSIDRATVSPEVGQVLDLVVAAESVVDELMELCGVYDPDDDEGSEPTASGSTSPVATAIASTEGSPTMTTPDGTPTGPAPAAPKKATATAPPGPKATADQVVLDPAAFAALQEQAKRGMEAYATLQAQADARVVDDAIDKGKITPARRDHYLALMSADRDATTTLLNETLQEAAIPLTEIGHMAAQSDAGPTAKADLDNPLFKDWMVS